MIKTTIYLLVGFLIYNMTNGPIINIFDEPTFLGGIPNLYTWNIMMQFLAVAWVFYGLKNVPFMDKVKEK